MAYLPFPLAFTVVNCMILGFLPTGHRRRTVYVQTNRGLALFKCYPAYGFVTANPSSLTFSLEAGGGEALCSFRKWDRQQAAPDDPSNYQPVAVCDAPSVLECAGSDQVAVGGPLTSLPARGAVCALALFLGSGLATASLVCFACSCVCACVVEWRRNVGFSSPMEGVRNPRRFNRAPCRNTCLLCVVIIALVL